MSFAPEPTAYEKSIVSELQGAWIALRESVVEQAGFPGWDRLLFHIDEAMSWESVRDLDRMRTKLHNRLDIGDTVQVELQPW